MEEILVFDRADRKTNQAKIIGIRHQDKWLSRVDPDMAYVENKERWYLIEYDVTAFRLDFIEMPTLEEIDLAWMEAREYKIANDAKERLEKEENGCTCEMCRQACQYRPGWATPDEVKALLINGYGDRLMGDWWQSDDDVWIISPAIKGYEGEIAPGDPRGRCAFYTYDGLCELHDKGLKPMECRTIIPCIDDRKRTVHSDVADTWRSDDAQQFARQWLKDHDLDPDRTLPSSWDYLESLWY